MSSSDAVVEVKEAMTNLDLKEKAKVEAKIAMMLKLDVAKHDFQVETGSDTDAVKVVLEKAMPQDEKAPQEKKPELNISGENSENMNPSEASKKNKKKKKKPAPATAEEIGKKVDVVEKKEDVKEVLGEIGDNGGENATEVNVIIFFGKLGQLSWQSHFPTIFLLSRWRLGAPTAKSRTLPRDAANATPSVSRRCSAMR